MQTDADHTQLAEALTATSAQVVPSGYPSPLYTRLYRDWHQTLIPASTQQGGDNAARTEVLWTNFQPHPTLFDLPELNAVTA